jgi:hypothetical protein
MGWLRDLMRASRSPIKSFDELAARCLNQASWPQEIAVQKRSLGALLGKLDRELELEWLTHRPSVQSALAEVLGISREELLLASAPVTQRVDGRHLRLDDLPTGRPLDLAREALFPGLPSEVLNPAAWSATWWLAPTGSGRTLVGAWLRARGLVGSNDDPSGPTYIELDPPEGVPHARPGLCVAATFAPPEDSGFKVVRSDKLRTNLAELVDWAADRLPDGGAFDRSELCSYLSAGPLAEGWLDSAGAVLGLVGLAEELGVAELRRRTGSKLARLFLRRRSNELLDPDAASTDWIKRGAADAMVALLRRSIVDADLPWWVSRTLEEWSDLLPAELRLGADLEWLKLAFTRSESGIRPRDLERAARELPPGAFRVLRALTRLGVLANAGEERLTLRPHWLVSALTVEAVDQLSRAAPSDFGEALLRPHAAPRIATALFERSLRDPALVDEILDLEVGDEPALAAAVECVVRCTGVALLRGVDIGTESVESLLDLALELSIRRDHGALAPRIEHRARAEAPPSARLGQGLLSNGVYQLALLALSEELPDLRRRRSTRQAQVKELDLDRLDAIERALERWPELDVAKGTARLCGRLALHFGHSLAAPAAVLRSADSSELDWKLWSAAVGTAFGRAALLGELGSEPAKAAPVLRAVWSAWETAERPELPALEKSLTALLWSHAPVSALEHLASSRSSEHGFEHLNREQWRTLVGLLERDARSPESLAFWRAVPEPELETLLALGLEPSNFEALAALWRRAPARLGATLEARFERGLGKAAGALLASVPAALTAETAQKLAADERLARQSSERMIELGTWLHERVAERCLGWREAYSRLSELERRLALARV